MDRPVRFIIEERTAPTEGGGTSRTFELRLALDAEVASRAAARVAPVAIAVSARRARVASILSTGLSCLRTRADRVVPALAPVAGEVKASIARNAGVIGSRVISEVKEADIGRRTVGVTKRMVERFNGKVAGPTCPNCGRETFLRVSKDNGQIFAACTGHDTAGCNFVEFIELGS